MKRLLAFVLIAAAGTAALIHTAGGLEGPLRSRPQPVVEETNEQLGPAPRIETGKGTPDIDALEGITQPAPPRRVVWVDRLSDERIEIPTFLPWRFEAQDARPLKRPDSERQSVICRNISFQMYREPQSRAEAMALVRNEEDAYQALLHQRFTAKEARVFGRLGEALSQRRGPPVDAGGLGDTELRLTGDVLISDIEQGLEIRGNELTVWPEQDRAEGDGLYTLRHEALVLTGTRLLMERDADKGYSRVSLEREPVLQLLSAGRDKQGKPIFDFGPGEFRPTTITAAGRAILVRQKGRSETTIAITLSDKVVAVQEGGRTLSAGHVELLATRASRPGVRERGGWELQQFRASHGVKVTYPGRTSKGGTFLTAVTANRLTHDVPVEGRPTTVLEGDVQILLRGEIAFLGPDGRLRLMCRDRAWIGPLPAGAPSGGLDRASLEQIGLRGHARIEREVPGPDRERDVLEADAIDLVVQPKGRGEDEGPLEMKSRMTAVHFAALGNVLLSGTRVRGTTHRLIGDHLHTERPHVTAEGRGTRFEFPQLGRNQRLLGPDAEPEASSEAPGTGADPDNPRSRWVVQRLLARGAVAVDTSMGGPALGMPAHLEGDEIAYDRLTRRARLSATGAAPARIAWSVSATETNQVETRVLTLDRNGGRITASGGVQGEIYVGRSGAFEDPRTGAHPALRDATLSVWTDHRIDLHLRRGGTSWDPVEGAEQVIRIVGPVTTQLRASDNSVDRMRSESLEVALAFLPPEPPSEDGPSSPTARVSQRNRSAPAPRTRPVEPLERLDVQAGALRIDMASGDVQFIEGTGGVDLKGRGGHVVGDRITYEGRTEVAEVHGTSEREAVAYLGASDQRSEVRASRIRLDLSGGEPRRLEAEAPPGKTSDVHLYRDDPKKRGQLERFHVTYEGRIVITNELLQAGRVRVIRHLREPGRSAWGEPAVLHSPTLRVVGRQLLATGQGTRDITRIVAEGRAGSRQGEVYFDSGSGEERLQIWGHRFDFDVVNRQAQLTGLPARDVTMQRGSGQHMWFTRVTVDMKTNLPSAEGSRILWRPR